jgi:nicotinamide-nucleotide amidase
VGLVWFASAVRGGRTQAHEVRFGDIGRGAVRAAALATALEMLAARIGAGR